MSLLITGCRVVTPEGDEGIITCSQRDERGARICIVEIDGHEQPYAEEDLDRAPRHFEDETLELVEQSFALPFVRTVG